jgi:GTP-binding protein HflX
VKRLLALHPGAVATSALTGDGLAELAAAVTATLADTTDKLELVIPYERGDLVALLHDIGRVSSEEHTDAGTRLTATVPSTELHRFAGFVTE